MITSAKALINNWSRHSARRVNRARLGGAQET
jgi:hypothetical protein